MFDVRKMQEQVIYLAVEQESDGETANVIVYGQEGKAKSQENGEWAKSTMQRLERKFSPEAVKQIRMACQCGYGMDEKLALVKNLMATSSSLEELGSSEKAKEAGLFYSEGVLYLQFHSCPCPMVAEVDRLDTTAWCQCTTGYSKVLFEKAFGCPVDVELLKSIKMGDDICMMSIIPREPIPAFPIADRR